MVVVVGVTACVLDGVTGVTACVITGASVVVVISNLVLVSVVNGVSVFGSVTTSINLHLQKIQLKRRNSKKFFFDEHTVF